LEVVGMARTFSVYPFLPGSATPPNSFTTTGGGFGINSNLGIRRGPGLRLIENFFAGRGIGRYLQGQGPDLVVNANGSPNLVRAASWMIGVEYQSRFDQFRMFGYYGGYYFGRTYAEAAKTTGYGVASASGANQGNNRTIQEYTVGFQRTLWEDNK